MPVRSVWRWRNNIVGTRRTVSLLLKVPSWEGLGVGLTMKKILFILLIASAEPHDDRTAGELEEFHMTNEWIGVDIKNQINWKRMHINPGDGFRTSNDIPLVRLSSRRSLGRGVGWVKINPKSKIQNLSPKVAVGDPKSEKYFHPLPNDVKKNKYNSINKS